MDYVVMRTFVDSQTLCSVLIPDEWVVDDSGRQGCKAIFLSPEVVEGFRPNVTLVVQPMSVLTREECLTLSRLQVRHLVSIVRFDADRASEQSEGSRILEWTVWQATPPLKVRQLLFFDTGNMYVLTATIPVAVDEARRPVVEEMFRSVCIRKRGVDRESADL
jgi:hypothetical protein